MTDSILIVDDEEGVRRTMAEWLAGSGLPIRVTAVADAAAALLHANAHAVDLAILDWNLGSGSDGLRLLEDLVEFQPHLIAILVTGYAARATPLQALRMGVRDYLDKNAEFTREAFLAAVRKQLAALAPAKRERQIQAKHSAFRQAVDQILPLVRGAATLHEPVSLPDAVRALLAFLIRVTKANGGAILATRKLPDGTEKTVAYAADGASIDGPFPPFSRTLAAAVQAAGRPMAVADFAALGPIDLLPTERGRSSLLLVPFAVGPGLAVTVELFDKSAWSADDLATAAAGAEIGSELVKHIVADRQTARTLFDAVEAALTTTDATADSRAAVAKAKESIRPETPTDDPTLPLLEAVRDLANRHGPRAVAHCTTLVRDLAGLLDHVAGVAP